MSALAVEYVARGLPVTEALHILHVPRSIFYSTHEPAPSKAGSGDSAVAMRIKAEETVFLPNETVVGEMKTVLSQEFICYGYKKMARQLQRDKQEEGA